MQYIQLQPQLNTDIPTPPIGSFNFYIDSSDNSLRIKNAEDVLSSASPYITGGTYSDSTITLVDNFGTSVSITGISTEDIYVTGGTYSNGTITFTDNNGNTFNVTGLTTADLYVTGGTYSNGTLTLTNNNNTNFSVTGFSSGSVSFTEVTYNELAAHISGSTLVSGSYYMITDFQTCYDQPDYDNNNNAITSVTTYHTAEIDPIIVFATSANTISEDAYQPSYPNDKIKYDYSFNATERTGGPAKGRITERIDEYNNRTDYDHRTIKFKRYSTYFLGETFNGRITGFTDGTVYGSGTNFVTDLAEGSVIFIETDTPRFFKVVNITSETEMIVHGYNYDNFSNSFGYRFWYTSTRGKLGAAGGIYYFNDVGNNDISDGGNDMYDGANEIYTNLFNVIPYTHTQMTNPPFNTSQQVSESAFVMDGAVQSGDTYFGAGSYYFTNLYPGLFVMVATGVTINEFYIDGNIGADGNGQADLFDYTLSLSGNDFSVYCKRVWDAGNDPSINHVFIVNTIDQNITHDADLTTNDDYDKIYNLSGVTEVHYILFGLARGVKPTNEQIENIVLDYLSNVDLSNINNTLSNLNINYSAITANVPPNDLKIISLEYKQHNFSGDTNYDEEYTFSNLNYFANNYIGDFASLIDWNENDFLLSNNIFTNADDDTVDVMSNNFGNLFYNNSFGDGVSGNLFIGQSFYSNTFYARFDYNLVKRDFRNNIWYRGELNKNNIGANFFDNWSSDGDFRDNVIGNDFYDNSIRNSFYENNIGVGFRSNMIHSLFYRNTIAANTNNNNFYGVFYENTVGFDFANNNIWSQMLKNSFKNSISNNNFGLTNNQNIFEISNNSFGNTTIYNTFSGNTRYNDILDNFENNSLGYDFSYNKIGSYFYGNVIKDGFGFGNNVSQGNVIGNYFYNNVVGEYFYNNTIIDGFFNNDIGDYFQMNNIKSYYLNGIDFTYYYGNVTTFTYTAAGNSATDTIHTNVQGTTNGIGTSASFNIEVSAGAVIGVTGNTQGKLYALNNTITILGSQIGGVDGVDNVVITVTGISPTPSVYEPYNCEIFKNSGNIDRLSYYDYNDILTIKNINE